MFVEPMEVTVNGVSGSVSVSKSQLLTYNGFLHLENFELLKGFYIYLLYDRHFVIYFLLPWQTFLIKDTPKVLSN